MSNDELERRLRGLEPAEVRAHVRGRVLDAVRAELNAAPESRLDRLLAKRTTWVAAAAVLVALLGANLFVAHRAERSRAERKAAIEADGRSLVEYHIWLARRTPGEGR